MHKCTQTFSLCARPSFRGSLCWILPFTQAQTHKSLWSISNQRMPAALNGGSSLSHSLIHSKHCQRGTMWRWIFPAILPTSPTVPSLLQCHLCYLFPLMDSTCCFLFFYVATHLTCNVEECNLLRLDKNNTSNNILSWFHPITHPLPAGYRHAPACACLSVTLLAECQCASV